MVKRMEVKLAKFRDFVLGLAVDGDMMSSDLPRAMARVARVPGESHRMEGVSKIDLGVETLSALGVAISNANMVFDMCVNDEHVFREMEQGLWNSVADLEKANVKLVKAGELLDQREAEIAGLRDQLGMEKEEKAALQLKLVGNVEELRCRKVLLKAAMLWVRRVKETLVEKKHQLSSLGEEKTNLQVENEKLQRALEVARKEATDLRAFAGQRKEALVKMDRMMVIVAAHAVGYAVPPEVMFSPEIYDKQAQTKAVEFCCRFNKKTVG